MRSSTVNSIIQLAAVSRPATSSIARTATVIRGYTSSSNGSGYVESDMIKEMLAKAENTSDFSSILKAVNPKSSTASYIKGGNRRQPNQYQVKKDLRYQQDPSVARGPSRRNATGASAKRDNQNSDGSTRNRAPRENNTDRATDASSSTSTASNPRNHDRAPRYSSPPAEFIDASSPSANSKPNSTRDRNKSPPQNRTASSIRSETKSSSKNFRTSPSSSRDGKSSSPGSQHASSVPALDERPKTEIDFFGKGSLLGMMDGVVDMDVVGGSDADGSLQSATEKGEQGEGRKLLSDSRRQRQSLNQKQTLRQLGDYTTYLPTLPSPSTPSLSLLPSKLSNSTSSLRQMAALQADWACMRNGSLSLKARARVGTEVKERLGL